MKRGPKPKPLSERGVSFCVYLHPRFIELFNEIEGANGRKIEQAFGFDRLNPGRGFVPSNVQPVTISGTEDRSAIETFLAVHG